MTQCSTYRHGESSRKADIFNRLYSLAPYSKKTLFSGSEKATRTRQLKSNKLPVKSMGKRAKKGGRKCNESHICLLDIVKKNRQLYLAEKAIVQYAKMTFPVIPFCTSYHPRYSRI
jgi:hypothetical protein